MHSVFKLARHLPLNAQPVRKVDFAPSRLEVTPHKDDGGLHIHKVIHNEVVPQVLEAPSAYPHRPALVVGVRKQREVFASANGALRLRAASTPDFRDESLPSPVRPYTHAFHDARLALEEGLLHLEARNHFGPGGPHTRHQKFANLPPGSPRDTHAVGDEAVHTVDLPLEGAAVVDDAEMRMANPGGARATVARGCFV